MPSVIRSNAGRQLLVFGPQALTFDAKAYEKLQNQLQKSSRFQWILDVLDTLPGDLEEVTHTIDGVANRNARTHLERLNQQLRSGQILEVSFPLPSVLLSPLVIITQLTQYLDFLDAAFPNRSTDELLPRLGKSSVETMGLCTGTLSAFAVACSSELAEFKQYGAVAIRLAMLVGALVDAEEANGQSVSLSAHWTSEDSRTSMEQVLKQFQEAYISVFIDERRATLTISKESASKLVHQLRSASIHVTEVALCGRFHWQKNEQKMEQLSQICKANSKFRFPDASALILPSRSSSGGQYLLNGTLHDIALRSILVEQSEWYRSFSVAHASLSDSDIAPVFCFGVERCIPPTMVRKLGSRLIQISDIDLATSRLPQELLNVKQAQMLENLPDERIAVIGVAVQAPGSDDLEEFWKTLSLGKSQHQEVPAERFEMETNWRELDSKRTWFGNFIRDYDAFDHKFFKKSPREMSSTDPQHRLALQVAYQAVEQSGYFNNPDFDKNIACYMGVGNVDYENNIAHYPANAYSATGNLKSFLAGKISHYFGWTGPSLTMDTACSSSSVAIHHACRAIVNGECTAALAGGANVITSPDWYLNLAGASFLSPTGQCKPFDSKGDGYCRGEGIGAVFLKKLSSAIADGDQILGVIASSKVYQNQNCTAITVPNALSLSELFRDVVQKARLEPKEISFVEAHGTGTAVGDPAEYEAIRRVFGGSIRSDTVSLGSVKGLVGHTECASGVISLVKMLLMMQEQSIPPQASFSSINPSLNASPADRIDISTTLKPWQTEFKAALINNYGASGSNASLVVTEMPKQENGVLAAVSIDESAPFWFSGLDERRLQVYVKKLRAVLQRLATSLKGCSASNLSFQNFRQSNRSLPQALILNARNLGELEQKLSAFERGDKSIAPIQRPSARPVILCFGGQVSTCVGLDRAVFDGATILRSHLDQCNAMCLSLGLESIYPEIFQRSPIEDIVKLQTVLFSMQYSCARAWIDSGIEVVAVVGHSFGELTALCVTKAISLRDALKMISGRARIIKAKWGPGNGSMLAVEGDLSLVETLLAKSRSSLGSDTEPSIACYNGQKSFTLAGSRRAIEIADDIGRKDPEFSGMRFKKLNVTNAFHSVLVDPLLGDLEDLGRTITFSEPSIQLERATEHGSPNKLDSHLIADHLRRPVFFTQAVQRLHEKYPAAIWLEAGSNSTITKMASRALGNANKSHFQPVNITTDGANQMLVDVTLNLWREGSNVNFWAHHRVQVSAYSPVLLPPYQFEKSKHWMELKKVQKIEAPEPQPAPVVEAPKGLTIFLGWEGTANRSAKFQVNTKAEKFQKLIAGHVMANTAAVWPSVVQVDAVLDALSKLRSDFQDLTFQPQLEGMENYHPLVVDDSRLVLVEAESSDPERLIWSWKLISSGTTGSATTHHTSGAIVFKLASDTQTKAEFQQLERLVSRRRCLDLLEGNHADDVLQGRNVYRAFSEVIDYKEIYRHVVRLVGKNNESAGRVSKKSKADSWLDPALADCFCQVAGIFVNLMTDKADITERGLWVGDGINRWFRSPKLAAEDSLPDDWEVFALHQSSSESRFLSDVFVFDPRDGKLAEVFLGISYQRVAINPLRKMLTRLLPPESSPVQPVYLPAAALTQKATPVLAPAPISVPIPKQVESKAEKVKKVKIAKKESAYPRPVVLTKLRDILCNLSGLESEEVQEDSDLVELGIDSLMSMELAREVDLAFKCTLDTMVLMDVTDFNSLIVVIKKFLDDSDGGNEEGNVEVYEDEEDDEGYSSMNGSTLHMNGIQSQINGTTPLVNGNGAHITNVDTHINGKTAPINGVSPPSENDGTLSASLVFDTFREIKEATDDFIVNGELGSYYDKVMPRSTELCVAHVLNAFESLGCPIRSAVPGEQLERVPYLPRHQQFMDLIYDMLQTAGLVEIKNGVITRTAKPPPAQSVDVMLEALLRDEPVHSPEHRLTDMIGKKFANCLTGKEDGLQLIFGSPEGRDIVGDVYAKSPINRIWITQAAHFLETLVSRWPKDGEPLRILEMGAGTGGTTVQIVPLLARLGVPVEYTITDLSPSLVASARKRFKEYKFMKFKVVNIESEPDQSLVHSQHVILATNCVHATRNLVDSTTNIRKILRPDGFLLLLEMTERVPWVDFIFGLVEGWWLFEDGRNHALQPPTYWNKVLSSVGYGHVDWTDGNLPEANVQRLIIAMASKPRYDSTPTVPEPTEGTMLTDNSGRQTVIDAYVREYTKHFQVPSSFNTSKLSNSEDHTVLVTGATGSLGSHIVAALSSLSNVHSVICLNRVSTADAFQRQETALRSKGTSFDSSLTPKLRVIETDTTKPQLGLSMETYQSLVSSVTRIVHNAWPMSITRPIKAFEPQFCVMRSLINLASEALAQHTKSFRVGFQFISSIGTVGHYPLWSGRYLCPEDRMTAKSVLPSGYSDAKLVCERMLDATLHRYPERFRPMAVRIGQISGSTSNGYWNPTEHLVFLIKSSQALKIFPDFQGTLSWCPVNDVAGTLCDLLLSQTSPHPIYHIENPSRQSWKEMTGVLAEALNIPKTNIIPFERWIDQVRNSPLSIKDNPAKQLVDFLDTNFVRMSCGGLVLDTKNTKEHSETLRKRDVVDRDLVLNDASASIFNEQWIIDLQHQLLTHLRANVAWLGLAGGSKSASPEAGRMLDYACGNGIVSQALYPQFAKCIGMDVSSGMVSKYNAAATGLNLPRSRMQGVVGDLVATEETDIDLSTVEALEAQDLRDFDLVVISLALHHLEDVDTSLRRLADRVRPGGTLLVIDLARIDDGLENVEGRLSYSGANVDETHPEQQHHHQHHNHGHQNRGHGNHVHPAAHTVAHDSFTEDQMRESFKKAGCGTDFAFRLHSERSVMPQSRRGWMQIFFARGTKV